MLRFLAPLFASASIASADVPKVVTDIAPVHGLVAMVMEGVGAPDLILPPGASPHHHAMRPSEARALAGSDLVVWIGHGLTPWLETPLESLASGAGVLTLEEAAGTVLLEMRQEAIFDGHDHGHGHGHDDHEDEHGEEHGHDGHEDDHDEEHGHDDHDDDHDKEHGHDDHEQALSDPHVWLDPVNASVWLQAIAERLSLLDPENAATYAANAKAGQAIMASLQDEISATLAGLGDAPIVVLHDGFQYFEARFGLTVVAAISDGDAAKPGPARVAAVRDHLRETGARCILSEPGTQQALVATVAEGTDVGQATLDLLGAGVPLGVTHYADTLRGIAASVRECIGERS